VVKAIRVSANDARRFLLPGSYQDSGQCSKKRAGVPGVGRTPDGKSSGGENSDPECTLTYCVRRAIYLGDATQIVARACCAIREAVGGGEWKKGWSQKWTGSAHSAAKSVGRWGICGDLPGSFRHSQHRTRPQQATTSEPSPGKKERNVFCHGACSNSREGTARPGARSGHSPFSAAAFWAFVSYQPVNYFVFHSKSTWSCQRVLPCSLHPTEVTLGASSPFGSRLNFVST
jgi:hypothetical protein